MCGSKSVVSVDKYFYPGIRYMRIGLLAIMHPVGISEYKYPQNTIDMGCATGGRFNATWNLIPNHRV